MTFPNSSHKHDQLGILTAAKVAAYRQAKRPSAPRTIILCYQNNLLQHAKKKLKGKRVAGFFGETYVLKKTQNRVAVAGNFGIGAPVTAVLVEDFIAWGVQQFLIIGIAGTLSPNLQAGDVVVAERALRDEGTSHHYLPSQKYVNASPRLTAVTQQTLNAQNIPFSSGATWTTDAPYRETAVEIEAYQQEGVLTVEMEAAALFAVAQARNVDAAALFCISDSIAHGQWHPASNPQRIAQQLTALFDVLVMTLQ